VVVGLVYIGAIFFSALLTVEFVFGISIFSFCIDSITVDSIFWELEIDVIDPFATASVGLIIVWVSFKLRRLSTFSPNVILSLIL
jgi:hypothetical protein